MKEGWYTIMLLSGPTSAFQKVAVPKWLLRLSLLLLAILLISPFAFICTYISSAGKTTALKKIEQENQTQKTEIIAFAKEIEQLRGQMIRMEAINSKLQVMVGAKEPNIDSQITGVGGEQRELFYMEIRNRQKELITQMHKDLKELKLATVVQEDDLQNLLIYLEDKASLLAATPSIRPTEGWLTSGFGYRISAFTGKREFHKGIDIATRIGRPIMASADGIASYVGYKGGFGNVIVLEHGYGFSTVYGHCSKVIARVGEDVTRGQVIAYVGNTGRSTGPHLHYEVRVRGVPVNPMEYILDTEPSPMYALR